ncbi:MAG: CRISPR-associated endonuclease Cas2 [Thermodesulfobacteriota bacterium]
MMFVVISYDIVDDKKRYRLAKLLKNYGLRVQKSVFECSLDEKNYLKMKAQAEKIMDHEEDSIRYYFLCGKCQAAIQVSGWGTVSEDEEVSIV